MLTTRISGARSKFTFGISLELFLKIPNHSFAKALATLFELGVPTQQFVSSEPWLLPTVDELNSQEKK